MQEEVVNFCGNFEKRFVHRQKVFEEIIAKYEAVSPDLDHIHVKALEIKNDSGYLHKVEASLGSKGRYSMCDEVKIAVEKVKYEFSGKGREPKVHEFKNFSDTEDKKNQIWTKKKSTNGETSQATKCNICFLTCVNTDKELKIFEKETFQAADKCCNRTLGEIYPSYKNIDDLVKNNSYIKMRNNRCNIFQNKTIQVTYSGTTSNNYNHNYKSTNGIHKCLKIFPKSRNYSEDKKRESSLKMLKDKTFRAKNDCTDTVLNRSGITDKKVSDILVNPKKDTSRNNEFKILKNKTFQAMDILGNTALRKSHFTSENMDDILKDPKKRENSRKMLKNKTFQPKNDFTDTVLNKSDITDKNVSDILVNPKKVTTRNNGFKILRNKTFQATDILDNTALWKSHFTNENINGILEDPKCIRNSRSMNKMCDMPETYKPKSKEIDDITDIICTMKDKLYLNSISDSPPNKLRVIRSPSKTTSKNTGTKTNASCVRKNLSIKQSLFNNSTNSYFIYNSVSYSSGFCLLPSYKAGNFKQKYRNLKKKSHVTVTVMGTRKSCSKSSAFIDDLLR